jgi:hypothetical protein
MKQLMTLLFLSVLVVAPAAQADKLRIFSDAALTDSTLNDNAPRIANLYVVHDMDGGVGIRFRVAPGVGFTGVWLGETTPFFKVGNSQSDVSVAYGACLFGPQLILTVTYQLFGTSSPCSDVNVAPANGLPCVIITAFNCVFVEECVSDLGAVHVNCSVPVEPTTWGRVKALYRN